MKNLFSLFLLFGLLASSFVSAEDRTSDPNDINVPIVGTDDNWQVNLASQDRLTNEDFNIALKIEQTDQDDDDDEAFDDFNDSDDDNDDAVPISGASFGGARKEGFEKTADGDFDLILIRKEILRKARDDQDIDDDIDYTNDNDDSDETPEVEPVDYDLRPDNGKISTQVVSTDDEKNEIEDSDDGDDGDDVDIVDDQDDSHGDDVDDDYQQDNDSAMADDDYVNEPDAAPDNLYDDMDYDDNNDDDSDDGDDKDDATDNDDFQDYVKNSPFNSVNLQRMKLNITTIDIRPQDSDDTDDNLDDILFDADSDDEDSDFYDIYDTKYREELERGGLGPDEAIASYDYDIFIDIDDSAWASILTEERKQ